MKITIFKIQTFFFHDLNIKVIKVHNFSIFCNLYALGSLGVKEKAQLKAKKEIKQKKSGEIPSKALF